MSNTKKNEDNFIFLVFKILFGVLFLPFWWLQRIIPRRKNLWIFGAWDGYKYSDNSRALYEYILKNEPKIKPVWITKSSSIYNTLKANNLPVEMANSIKGIRTTLTASYIFATKGFPDVNIRFLNGITGIMLWHGMPLKQIGEDSKKFIPISLCKKFKTCIRKIFLPYEFIKTETTISNSEFFEKYLSSAFAISTSQIWTLGSPRNDKFFLELKDKYIETLNCTYNNPLKILYMPTHRDACSKQGYSFNPFEYASFNFTKLNNLMSEIGGVFLYKGHFFDSKEQSSTSNSRVITITDDCYNDLYTFIKDIDILITDYSSIYFDFLLCKKPIILFPFDQEEYTKHSRPFYFDYTLLKAIKVYNWDELITCIKEKLYKTPQEDECRLFNKYLDGNSSERIFNNVINLMNNR